MKSKSVKFAILVLLVVVIVLLMKLHFVKTLGSANIDLGKISQKVYQK